MGQSASEQPLIFKPSILRMLLLFFACLAFVIAGAFIFESNPTQQNSVFAGIGTVFFGGGAMFFLYRMMFRKPTLIVSSRGICPNYIFFKEMRQEIQWNDIEKIGKTRQIVLGRTPFMNEQEHLAIYLKNPQKHNFEKYVSKNTAENVVGALGGRHGSGIRADLYIPSTLLSHSISEVLLMLKKYPVKIEEETAVI